MRRMILAWMLAASLAACADPGLSDERAEAVAISKYVQPVLEEMRAYGGQASEGSIRSSIKEAVVASNDGQTAVVRLTIQIRRDLPEEYVDIEVSLEELDDY